MNIQVKVIPHKEQRYETAGDWWFDKDETLQIRVSKMSDWRYEMLVIFHELAEVLMCKHKGIETETVDAFDKNFETERVEGKHDENEEPGDADDAPYREQHSLATGLERILSVMLGVNWKKYDDEVMSL